MIKQIATYVLVATLGAAVGYWAMPKKEVMRTVERQVDRVIRTVKKPDGTVERVTTDKSRTTSNESTKLNVARPRYSASVLAGLDVRQGLPLYGAHVSKEFLGPITLGAWGLTSGNLNQVQLGLSIGVNF